MRTVWSYLVINTAGEMRLTKRTPRLKSNETARRIRVSIPDSPWGKMTYDKDLEVEVRQGEIATAEIDNETVGNHDQEAQDDGDEV
jgi:hypothetical protein